MQYSPNHGAAGSVLLDQAAIDDIRLALNQNQPLGNERFYAKIEKMTGTEREARPRGSPRLADNTDAIRLGHRRSPRESLPLQGEG